MGFRTLRMGAAALVMTRKSANLYYNRLVALGQASPATESQIDRALAAARDLGATALGVSRTRFSRPRKLTTWLKDRGFRLGHPGAKLWRDNGPLGPATSPVRVRRVRTADAGLWVELVAKVWATYGSRSEWFEARVRTEGWRHYLAWIDGRPVAAGALFVAQAGDVRVGHLVDGVTLGPWRRRGAQSAVIRRRVADGLALGCDLFCSETAPPLPRMPLVSFRNLCRQGFHLAYLRDNWRVDL